MNPTAKIILKNTCTLFNLVNLILAAMIATTGNYKNMLFIVIAIANTLISIINELRAKKIVDKMKLMTEQNPKILRNGQPIQIPLKDVAKNDIAILALGDQILFDAILTEGVLEVNESFITGEQDSIIKHPGDKLISGSFITAGSAKARVASAPEDSFIKKLEASAKAIKPANSKLFTILNNIVKYISYALIPIGGLLLWSRLNAEATTSEAITSTVAALISMIPEGLILLTSSALALSVIRLSRQKVLVHDLYSIETLARVDCICLDKTGTITTGQMSVRDIIPAKGQTAENLTTALELILAHLPADTGTSAALRVKFMRKANKRPTEQSGIEIIPFSSERKFSGIKKGNTEYLIGAPEFLTKNPDFLAQAAEAKDIFRTIAVMKKTGEQETLLGFVRIEDEIRKDARGIIEYFYDNDIDIRIISGDDKATVRNIAETVGIKNIKAVDLSTLERPNYRELVQAYGIFTRVTPAQKKQLIHALKEQGSTVAMTGDGVNDILAMKEADCSIAIGEGSDAARRAAKIVLLNSNFSAVPPVIAEGRRTINNIERSATLFLAKTVYASVLAVLFVILPLTYPYQPIEMSLLNFLCIGLPGFVLALESNTERIKDRFVKNIRHYSMPIGLAVAAAMVILSIVAKIITIPRPELTALSALITFAIDFVLIVLISRPFTKLRFSLATAILIVFAAVFLIPFARAFFGFA